MAKISVVICTRDRPDLIGQAVESVIACDYPDFDLHVMDQSTTDATRTVVEKIRDAAGDRVVVTYHHLDKAGLSRAYNAGLRVSDGPVVACTDDDVIVPSDWLACIARSFADDPQLGLLYGQVLVPPSLRDVGPETVVPSLTWERRERLFHSAKNFKVWGMGANMAVRREAAAAVGGFDEVMGGGAPLRSSQDFDFALRMYRSGYAVLLDPAVKVDHYGARTADQWPGTMKAYGVGDGAFYGKHVRCHDPLAAKLLAAKMVRGVGKAAYESARRRRLVPLGDYERNLFVGLREGRKWDVDRSRRLYRENDRMRIEATESNAVTGVKRQA